MSLRDKVYTLREETSESTIRHFISFTDSQGVLHSLEVSETLYIEFRQMERKNRNLQQSEWRHNEHSELTEQTLYKRAMMYFKSVDELIIEAERSELLRCAIAALPEIQKRRFLLYYEDDCNYYEIGAIEHCTAQAVRRSVIRAREKVKAQMESYYVPK